MIAKTSLSLFAALMVVLAPTESQESDARRRARHAIEAGSAVEGPQPYLLRFAQPEADGEQEAVAGAIYTPFLRVATVAAGRADARAALPLSEAEAMVNENVFYVVLRWNQDQASSGTEPPRIVAVPRSSGYFDEAVGVAPAWVAPGNRAATILGREPPWNDVGAIAAFPRSLFSPHYDFVIFTVTIDPASGKARRQHRRGRIARAEHAGWTW